jgi:hypothetical protein
MHPGAAQLLPVGGEGDRQAAQGAQAAAIHQRRLGAYVAHAWHHTVFFAWHATPHLKHALRIFWQGMISVKTLSKLAALRHEGALLVRNNPAVHTLCDSACVSTSRTLHREVWRDRRLTTEQDMQPACPQRLHGYRKQEG